MHLSITYTIIAILAGIMGVACRHEVPHLFINLHHGERLVAKLAEWCMFIKITLIIIIIACRISYAVYLMKRLMDKYPNHNINLLYDIACCLKKHLQVYYNYVYQIIEEINTFLISQLDKMIFSPFILLLSLFFIVLGIKRVVRFYFKS